MMDADVVLVANGGLGSAFDELELNRVLCLHHGVRLAGVILNKVRADKYEQTKEYMSRALMQIWGVPLLGCIPDRPFLGCPVPVLDIHAFLLLFSLLLTSNPQHEVNTPSSLRSLLYSLTACYMV